MCLFLQDGPGRLQILSRSQSRARVEGVDPGTAKVSFPDLDKKTYEPGGAG